MHHWRDGWFFGQFGNGDVEIKHVPVEKQTGEFGEGEADIGITIPRAEWESIVREMSLPTAQE